ncbi:MAG: FAD-dependent oxidoreductase [Campylobacterota bacterium]|nr:FAD-dependent oxidoreductase [Campylobacterota bacterium]
MSKNYSYDYVIIGAGIGGCSVAYELSKYSDNILIIDKQPKEAFGASGAAGAFLSPLLGKPNRFKDLVTEALKYSTKLYNENFPDAISSCGTVRIPKDTIDASKFETYIPYMDFEFKKKDDGYFFQDASVVDSSKICNMMLNLNDGIYTEFEYEVNDIVLKEDKWLLNDQITANNLILTTGADIDLIDEFYFNIRGVWGRRIDSLTSTKLDYNYHKECSISKSFPYHIENRYKVSIGATHHRDVGNSLDIQKDIDELLQKASQIVDLKDIEVLDTYSGARASSVDYLPIVGKLIDSNKTLEEFPYMKKGTHVPRDRFTRYKNLFVLNGLGGRGFVLAPYLSKKLVDHIVNKDFIDDDITCDRLFIREVKRKK